MVEQCCTVLAAPLVVLSCVAVSGCGRDGPERVVLTGTVTYQGEPVQYGRIRFLPADGTVAPMSGGYISKGRYVADAKGGVPVGTHRVEITAFRIDPKYVHLTDNPDFHLSANIEEIPRQQYIPEQYNAASKLTMTIPPGSRRIEKDFDL